jgi:predicted RND superfamily exporter protein
MKNFAEVVINGRRWIIGATILITLVLGYFCKNVRINSELMSYMPKSDPTVKLSDYIGNEYGGNAFAVIGLEAENVFTRECIAHVNTLTRTLRTIRGVAWVTSLTSVLDIRKTDDGLEISRLIDEYDLPETPEQLGALKEYVMSRDIYRGRLVSQDGRALLIICRIEAVNKIEIAQAIKRVAKDLKLPEKLFFAGLLFQMIDISSLIVHDLKFLMPLIILLIIVTLAVSFRSIRGVVLPLVSVLISTVWTVGLMSIFKAQFTIISDIIPVILIAVGSAYSIHVISKFNERENGQAVPAQKALASVIVPVLLAGVTTIAGFISFVFGSYLTLIREFGIFTALGVLIALVNAITFVPAALSFPSRPKSGPLAGIKRTGHLSALMSRLPERMSNLMLKRKKRVVIVFCALTILFMFGIPRVQRKVDFLDYFKPTSPLRNAENFMETRFGGSIPIQILVKGDMTDPAVLKKMECMMEFLITLEGIKNPQSLTDLITEMNHVMGEGWTIPEQRDKIANLWFLLEGQETLDQLVNSGKTEGVIQATVKGVYNEQSEGLIRRIEKYMAQNNSPECEFCLTGSPLVFRNLDRSIMRSQLQSLILAIVLIYACLVCMTRSLMISLAGLAPITFTLIAIFGVMGFLRIPLDIATVLVGSASIGVGIDYAIHFMNRYRLEARSSDPAQALVAVLTTTGRSILINVITVALGFIILIFASLVPLQRFGILIALTMVCSGIGSITLLPAILLVMKNNNKKEIFK